MKNNITTTIKLLAILTLFVVVMLLPKNVRADSLNKTTLDDWQSGKYDFNLIDVTDSGNIKLQQDMGSWDATGSADMNHYSYTREPMTKVGRFIYMLRNRASGQFMRYDLDTKEWTEMAWVPNQDYEVADLTNDGSGTIYAFATRYSPSIPNLTYKHFLKYDIATNTWSYLAEPPTELRNNASLEYVNGETDYIYAIQGNNTYGFWKYDVNDNSWTSIQNTTYNCSGYCDMVYDGSRYLYLATGWQNPDRLYRFDTQANLTSAWSQMANLPIDGALNSGISLSILGDYIITPRGAGGKLMYKYSINGNAWSSATNLPYANSYASTISIPEENKIIIYTGPSSFFDYYPLTDSYSDVLEVPSYTYNQGQNFVSDNNGNFYYCLGRNTSNCYKYEVATKTWTSLANPPTILGNTGVSLAYTDNKLYVNRGSNGNTFYMYDTVGGTWTTKASPPATITDGSAMIASGSASIFAARGGGQLQLYKYDIAGNTWSTKANAPEGIYRGAGMVQSGEFLYVLQGYNRGGFWRYSETADSWTRLKSVPTGVYYGGSLSYDGVDTMYVIVGGDFDTYSKRFYKYSISNNTWTRVADTPEKVNNGGYQVYYDGSIYAMQGNYSYAMWKYSLPVDENAYITSGSWYSPVYNLNYVSSYTSLTATESKPEGTTIQYYTRSSANQYLWEEWHPVTAGAIASTPAKYIQVKAILSSTGTSTPTLSDITINYTSDTTAPDVTGLSATGFSAEGGTALVSGGEYEHRNPYFTFSGVTDAGVGIEGYYVYFGSNDSADPEVDGNYQYTTNYTAALGLSYGDQLIL
jgi:hypothetical protein